MFILFSKWQDRCNRYNQLCPKLVFQQQIVPKVVQQQVVPEVVQQQIVPQVVQQQVVPEVVKQVVPEVVPQQVVTGAVPQQVVNAPVTQEDERQFFPQQYVVVPAVPQHITYSSPPENISSNCSVSLCER